MVHGEVPPMAEFDPGDGGFDGRGEVLSRADLEERVRERTAHLENVMDTMADVLLKVDADGTVRFANDAAETVLGYDAADLRDKPVEYVFAAPDANAELSDKLTSGKLVEQLLSEGAVADIETVFETADGDTVPMSLSASMKQGEDGELDGLVLVAKDIRERKAVEERAEFLHSLLRHDVQNKLHVTQGYLELLAESDLDEEQAEQLDRARRGVEDAFSVIKKVQTMNELGSEADRREVDLAAALRESVSRHDGLASREGITVEQAVDSVTVRAGDLVTELFANLVENALRHSGGSQVRITAEEGPDDVSIHVDDDGVGIPFDQLDEVFEHGVSTRDAEDSGRGMALVRGIAETYGGSVEVTESPLGGARVTVTLPR